MVLRKSLFGLIGIAGAFFLLVFLGGSNFNKIATRFLAQYLDPIEKRQTRNLEKLKSGFDLLPSGRPVLTFKELSSNLRIEGTAAMQSRASQPSYPNIESGFIAVIKGAENSQTQYPNQLVWSHCEAEQDISIQCSPFLKNTAKVTIKPRSQQTVAHIKLQAAYKDALLGHTWRSTPLTQIEVHFTPDCDLTTRDFLVSGTHRIENKEIPANRDSCGFLRIQTCFAGKYSKSENRYFCQN